MSRAKEGKISKGKKGRAEVDEALLDGGTASDAVVGGVLAAQDDEDEKAPAPNVRFWQAMSLMISLLGFLVTGATLLLRGEILLMAVVKALAVFIGLYVFHKLLGAVWVLVLGFEVREAVPSEGGEAPVASPKPSRN